MCEVCRMYPCDARCPNAPPPPMVFVCSGCSKPIREGDYYYDILGEQFCEDCIEDAKEEAVYDPD